MKSIRQQTDTETSETKYRISGKPFTVALFVGDDAIARREIPKRIRPDNWNTMPEHALELNRKNQ